MFRKGLGNEVTVPPPPGTIVLWSDLGCPWAHAAVARLRRTRATAGLDGRVVIDHRAFALEHLNRRSTPKLILDAEIPVAGALEPGAGWQMWQGPDWGYPVTTMLAMEAVQAAKAQSMSASESLDAALRVALFGQSRCISLRHVILEVADGCGDVDVAALTRALDAGTARAALVEQAEEATAGAILGSPHLFLPDGRDLHHPGVELEWIGTKGRGFPVVHRNDPSVYLDLLESAAPAD